MTEWKLLKVQNHKSEKLPFYWLEFVKETQQVLLPQLHGLVNNKTTDKSENLSNAQNHTYRLIESFKCSWDSFYLIYQ